MSVARKAYNYLTFDSKVVVLVQPDLNSALRLEKLEDHELHLRVKAGVSLRWV